MTDKELRKLRREDLLQILIDLQRQIDALKAEVEQGKEALANRDMAIRESGTLAEAALKMNGVFDAAQSAADEYLRQMRKQADELVAEAEQKAEEARKTAETLVRNARSEAEQILRKAKSETGQSLPDTPPQPQQAAGADMEDAEGKRRRRSLWGNRKT